MISTILHSMGVDPMRVQTHTKCLSAWSGIIKDRNLQLMLEGYRIGAKRQIIFVVPQKIEFWGDAAAKCFVQYSEHTSGHLVRLT